MEQELTPHDLRKAAQRPVGVVSVREELAYLAQDRCFDKKGLAEYWTSSTRFIETHLQKIPHFRLFGSKLIFRKSEIDEWMEQWRESGGADLNQIADEVVEQVLKDAS